MIQRCEAEHGRGNCERYIGVYYPKCKEGYYSVTFCFCRPISFSSCKDVGYATNARLDLSCGKDIILGDPTPLFCRPDQEQDGLICYPFCNSGFDGVGSVCWQKCGESQVTCLAGCAVDEFSCVFAGVDMAISATVIAVNIASLGVLTPVTGAIDAGLDSLMVGGKVMQYTGKVGKGMLFAVKYILSFFETLKIGRGLTYLQKLRHVRIGTSPISIAWNVFKLSGKALLVGFKSVKFAERQFAADFIEMTSAGIAAEIDSNLSPVDANYVKGRWAQIQLMEMAVNQAWLISGAVLSVVGIFDITGTTDLVHAYLKPICSTDFLFPKPTNALSMSSLLLPPNPSSTLALSKPEMLLSSKDIYTLK